MNSLYHKIKIMERLGLRLSVFDDKLYDVSSYGDEQGLCERLQHVREL